MRNMGNNDGSVRALVAAFVLGLFRPLGTRTSQLLYLLVFAVAFVLAAHHLWVRYGDQVLARDEYTLDAEMIELVSIPSWIRTDIKRQAFEDGSLGQLRLTQPDLALRVANAFALQPWVSRVKRVNPKYGRVTVELEYREPVAMVWVTDESGRPALLAVDAHGIVLPTADFPDQDSSNPDYLHIEVANASVWPADIWGACWGDERVHGAARLAATLRDTWQRLGLQRIVVTTRQLRDGSVGPPTYQLISRDGVAVIWGSAPGRERAGEPDPRQKITRLLDTLETHHRLPPDPPLDLRVPDAPSVAAKPN
jgi:hypothetical protein